MKNKYCLKIYITNLFITWCHCDSVDNVMSEQSCDHTCNNILERLRNVIANIF